MDYITGWNGGESSKMDWSDRMLVRYVYEFVAICLICALLGYLMWVVMAAAGAR